MYFIVESFYKYNSKKLFDPEFYTKSTEIKRKVSESDKFL